MVCGNEQQLPGVWCRYKQNKYGLTFILKYNRVGMSIITPNLLHIKRRRQNIAST